MLVKGTLKTNMLVLHNGSRETAHKLTELEVILKIYINEKRKSFYPISNY